MLAFLLVFLFTNLTAFPQAVSAQVQYSEGNSGDHFVYQPGGSQEITGILVIAHGTRHSDEIARDTSKRFLLRWTGFADENGLLLIAPVFDDERFGNTGGGYGGYRGLFGRDLAADEFVIDIVRHQQSVHGLTPSQFLLYGHSAGAQFAGRFTVRHPELISFAVLSAPGRYSYPTLSAKWPYGAGVLQRVVKWPDGTIEEVRVRGDLGKFAAAAGRMFVLVGAKDTSTQPSRPGHTGTNRVELMISWLGEMNENAARQGYQDLVRGYIVPDIGHDSEALTPYAQRVFKEHLSLN
ncbi:hypothetical protein ACSQ76_21910 [Roseovarius sp. B08]|uniref:hypothetical protein n=1 Tax=Roseovarius sp. B08 TaxID=3449223 RepID=UPI003EDB74CE